MLRGFATTSLRDQMNFHLGFGQVLIMLTPYTRVQGFTWMLWESQLRKRMKVKTGNEFPSKQRTERGGKIQIHLAHYEKA